MTPNDNILSLLLLLTSTNPSVLIRALVNSDKTNSIIPENFFALKSGNLTKTTAASGGQFNATFKVFDILLNPGPNPPT